MLLQKIKKGRCEKEAFVLDRPLKLKVKCENDAFARDVLQKLKAEDVKTKLSCETSFEK